jgi:hypothetical protein
MFLGFLFLVVGGYQLWTRQPGDLETLISGSMFMILSYVETNHAIVLKKLKEIKNGKE